MLTTEERGALKTIQETPVAFDGNGRGSGNFALMTVAAAIAQFGVNLSTAIILHGASQR